MRETNQTLHYLVTRVGAGDNAAFRCLYSMLAPGTLIAVQEDLPDPTHSMHVVRATFTEVWWMCAFDVRCGAHRYDVSRWVSSIADRRCTERRQALALTAQDAPPANQTAFWTGLLDERDTWTQFQLTAMLDGHDGVRLPPRPRRPVHESGGPFVNAAEPGHSPVRDRQLGDFGRRDNG
jgi:hypothetical protein